jgi:hypothetical protein
VSSLSGLFGWLPKRHATARRRAQTRHALAGLDFALGELARELKRLAEMSRTTDQDDAAAVVRETVTTSRILELLAQGESLASQLSDKGIADAWQRLAGSTGRARLLGSGPHRVIKLMAAAGECEWLQQLVDQKLAV